MKERKEEEAEGPDEREKKQVIVGLVRRSPSRSHPFQIGAPWTCENNDDRRPIRDLVVIVRGCTKNPIRWERNQRKIAEIPTKYTMSLHEDAEDIVIVGGRICGLAFSLALHRKGINALVFEKSETI
ncbi:hypothetical protein K1719_041006 [Acacia pycnantha]|nr:hypothetical protein K1719_041006 [Acacia pycnantha]